MLATGKLALNESKAYTGIYNIHDEDDMIWGCQEQQPRKQQIINMHQLPYFGYTWRRRHPSNLIRILTIISRGGRRINHVMFTYLINEYTGMHGAIGKQLRKETNLMWYGVKDSLLRHAVVHREPLPGTVPVP